MTRQQALRLGKAIKNISAATGELLSLSEELAMTPKEAVSVAAPAAEIALANERLLTILKKHSEIILNEQP